MIDAGLYTYRAHVLSVYDGDTITVDVDLGFSIFMRSQSIRLARINAPEVRGSNAEMGAKSRDALREKILGKTVTLKTIKDTKEKYGRWLAEVWIDGVCINNWLLAEGLAVAYT
jgi:micrococcal nuclease